MVIFLITLLGVSIVGLVGLVAVKRWEMQSGHILFSAARPSVGLYLSLALNFVEERAPELVRQWAARAWKAARAGLHFLVAWAVLHVERMLERTLHTLRHTTQERSEGEASAFLREVAEHKKSLMGRSGKKRGAIYEE